MSLSGSSGGASITPIAFQISSIDVPADWQAYVAELGRLFPAEGSGFRDAVHHHPRHSRRHVFAADRKRRHTRARHDDRDAAGIFAAASAGGQWLDKPFDQLVARHIGDPRARQLIAALTGYISDGSESLTCAEMVPLFGYYFHGGYHPVGGSRKFVDALAAAIGERGGQLWLNSPVAKISVENGSATGLVLADGRRVSARAIVTNSDLKRTFLELVEPAERPERFSRADRRQRAGLVGVYGPSRGRFRPRHPPLRERQGRAEYRHHRDVDDRPGGRAAPAIRR